MQEVTERDKHSIYVEDKLELLQNLSLILNIIFNTIPRILSV